MSLRLKLKDLPGPVKRVKKKNKFRVWGVGLQSAGCAVEGFASERTGNSLEGFKDLCLKANARVWP